MKLPHLPVLLWLGLLLAFSGSPLYAQQSLIGTLPAVINESSGLETYAPNTALLWSHNDSGGQPHLYLFNTSNAQLIHTLQVTNFPNIDWEDLAQDKEGNMFIGDFGNNANNRTDLSILKVNVNELPETAPASSIYFNYPDQTAFPPPPTARNFDMEAMIYHNDSLYLFSKNILNFSTVGSGFTKLYTLPAVPGTYTAQLIDSLYTLFPVTAADIAPSGKAVALLCYSRLYILHSFSGNNFFNGLQQMYSITPLFPPKQTEAVVFKDCSSVYITAEDGDLLVYNFAATFPPPVAQVASASVTICAGDTAQLFASGGNSYEWQPSAGLDNPYSPTPLVSPAATTTYTLTAYNQIGCADTKQVTITVENCPLATTPAIKLWLEGAYNPSAGSMSAHLNAAQLLPLTQPFNRTPWNYAGAEGIASPYVLPANIVDWVLVEVRHAATQQVVGRRAALLRTDGFIMDINQVMQPNTTEPKLFLYGLISNQPYLISVKTRNHIAAITANPALIANTSVFNFTQPANVLAANQHLKQMGDNYALCTGDANVDGIISFADFNKLVAASGASGIYSDLDFNFDGMVNLTDFNLYQTNLSRIGVPVIRE